MIRPFESWRRTIWLWGLPFAFCVLNLLVFAFYHSFYAGEVERLDALYQQGKDNLAALNAEGRQIEIFLARIDRQEENIEALYADHFQTQSERFLRSIREVEKLAVDAGLEPASWAYPQDRSSDLVRRQIMFSVQGTYQELRTFINLLELTDQFLTLDSVTLAEGGPNTLGIQLVLSTVFTEEGSGNAPAEEADE